MMYFNAQRKFVEVFYGNKLLFMSFSFFLIFFSWSNSSFVSFDFYISLACVFLVNVITKDYLEGDIYPVGYIVSGVPEDSRPMVESLFMGIAYIFYMALFLGFIFGWF